MMGYYTYEEFQEQLQGFSQHSHLTIGELGRTLQNRPIPYVKVGSAGPIVFTMAGTHPRELLAESFLLSALNALVEQPMESLQIYFVPILNIDAYATMSDHYKQTGVIEAFRKNLRPANGCHYQYEQGVDLNRNYDSKWGEDIGSSSHPCYEDYRGTGPFSEPETRAVKEFFSEHEVSLMMTYHAWGDFYIPPFNYLAYSGPELYDSLEDYRFYKSLQDIVPPKSKVGTAYELLGYFANGLFVDWAYAQGTFSLAVELGDEFVPSNPSPTIAEHLPTYFQLLNYTVPAVELNTTAKVHENTVNCSVTLKNPSLSHLADSQLTIEFENGVEILAFECSVPTSPSIEAGRATVVLGEIKRLTTVECVAQVLDSVLPPYAIEFKSEFVSVYYAQTNPPPYQGSMAVFVFAGIILTVTALFLCKWVYSYFRPAPKFQAVHPDDLGDIELQSESASPQSSLGPRHASL
jgi:hypothetical protein